MSTYVQNRVAIHTYTHTDICTCMHPYIRATLRTCLNVIMFGLVGWIEFVSNICEMDSDGAYSYFYRKHGLCWCQLLFLEVYLQKRSTLVNPECLVFAMIELSDNS